MPRWRYSPLPTGDYQAQGRRAVSRKPHAAGRPRHRCQLAVVLTAAEPRSLLEQPVSAWEEDDGYRAFRDFVRGLNVTNDAAERGVASP